MIYGYIRVSTDMQDTEAQKIGILDLAIKKGYAIEKWISDDGISGTVDYQKRQLGKLMKILKEGDVVFASEISRFARNLFMLFEILKYFTERKIEMYTVKDNYSLDGSLTSTVMAFAFGMAAQIERDMISKRTIEGLKQRRKEGVVLGRPMGSKSKRIKLDGKEDKIVEYLKAGLSYSAIARLLKVHRLTITKICEERGLSVHKKINLNNKTSEKSHFKILPVSKPIRTAENDLIIKFYKENGFSFRALAEEYGIAYSTIKTHLEKRGILNEMIELNKAQRQKCKSKYQIERENEIERLKTTN